MIYKVISVIQSLPEESPPSTPEVTRRLVTYKDANRELSELDKDSFLQKILLHLRLKKDVEEQVIQLFLKLNNLVKESQIDLIPKDIFFISITKILAPLQNGISTPDKFEERLKAATNGFFLPRGQIIFSLLKDTSIDAIDSVETLSKVARQLSLVRPYPCTMVFHNIELMVTAQLYNQFQVVEPKTGPQGLENTRKELKEWAVNSGFSKKQIATVEVGDFAKLAWLTTPYLDDPKRILVYAKFLTFLFFHDDIGDSKEALEETDAAIKIKERNELFKKIFKQEISGEVRQSKDPLIKCAIELSETINGYISEASEEGIDLNLGFLQRTLDKYFEYTAEETEDILQKKILGTLAYGIKRLETSALKVCFALSAILNQVPITDEQLEKKEMKALIDSGDLHVSYANDLISFPKEITSMSYSLTMIYLLESAKAEGLISMDEAFITPESLELIYKQNQDLIINAIKSVVKSINTEYFSYIQAEKSLKDPEDIKFATTVVRPWITGNSTWQSESDRYLNSSGFKGNITEYVGHLLTNKGFRYCKIGS